MRILKNYILILILIIFSACNNAKLSNEEIEHNAERITELLSEENIDVFRKWNFHYRGGEVWKKQINDSTVFSANYRKSEDTTKIYISKRYIKSNELNLKIDIDTSNFGYSFLFIKYKNGLIRFEGNDKNGKDILIGENLKSQDIFNGINPFSKLESLSNLKDKLKVYSIEYKPWIGDFIHFYVTYQDVLYYIPNKSTLNPIYKKVWIEKFIRGKEIKPNWNLLHLDKPKDIG